jgi:hypothetical protein
MEQRRLRLGDILDDYCPRERRVTNHAVVAMIEEDVKQTRCTTCDAEHVYKGGKEPRRRKKDAGTALFDEVLAGMPDSADVAVRPPAAPPIDMPPPAVADAAAAADDALDPSIAAEDEPEPSTPADDGPFHRRLIRATLPRPEGQKEVRQEPDFTIRQNGRPANPFRGGARMRGQGQGQGQGGNGHRPASGGGRGPGGAGRPRRFGGGAQPGGPAAGPGRGGRPGFGGNRGRKR